MSTTRAELAGLAGRECTYGLHTHLDADYAPRGLAEEVDQLRGARR